MSRRGRMRFNLAKLDRLFRFAIVWSTGKPVNERSVALRTQSGLKATNQLLKNL